MKHTNRRNLERNMKALLEEHHESNEPLLILSPGNKNPMIIITKARYDELLKMESEK